MKKYSILALALALCVTGLTGCRRNRPMEPATMPTTMATTAPTTIATTAPATAPSTHAATETTTTPGTGETGPMEDNQGSIPSENGAPSRKARSNTRTPGVG